MKSVTCAAVILAATVGLAATSCGEQTQEKNKQQYRTIKLEPESRTMLSELSARTQGTQTVEVRPQVSGLITRILINDGQRVTKGQPLFVIDQVPYQAALAEAEAAVKSAEAQLASARLEHDAAKALREQGIVEDYDLSSAANAKAQAEANLAQAKAKYVNAKNNLSYTTVTSPADGLADMIPYKVGWYVTPSISDPLVRISDSSTMEVYFSMTERDIADLLESYGSLAAFIEEAPELQLRMSNGKIYAHPGKLAAVSGIVTSSTGAVAMKADFPNPDGVLLSGGTGSIIFPETVENAVVIPQAATYEIQERVFVYKVVDGVTTSTQVTVSRINNGNEYVVTSGLQFGDVIIAEGAGLMKEGTKIE